MENKVDNQIGLPYYPIRISKEEARDTALLIIRADGRQAGIEGRQRLRDGGQIIPTVFPRRS